MSAPIFDPHDQEFIRDPYPTYERLRNEAPIFWHDRSGMWFVASYEDLDRLMRDNRLGRQITHVVPPEQLGLPPRRRKLFQSAVSRVQDALTDLKASGEPMRVLHGDLHLWNVKVYRGRVGALDFEDLIWGWPVQDIATTLYYLHGKPHYRDRVAAFRRGCGRCSTALNFFIQTKLISE